MRLVVYSLTGCLLCSTAVAKYCVKLPTCEELGYIYSVDKYPNNRSIKCPFDTKKILLLDYCQAYGLTSCDSTSGECDECIVEKADGTKSNSGYWRYTRCNAGYSYKSGECPPTEVDTSKYPLSPEQMNEDIGEIECVQSAQNTYCGYTSCNEGWYQNKGACIANPCDGFPYTSCDENGTCGECKAGFEKRYGDVTCNLGYARVDNKCVEACISAGTCEIGDIYAYNNIPIGVVFYNDNTTTKIVALGNVDSTGVIHNHPAYWAYYTQYQWYAGTTVTADAEIAEKDMNGKYNTNKILTYISANSKTAQAATATSLYTPSICDTGSICAKGNWYLPAFGELVIQYSNRSTLNTSLTEAGGSAYTNDYYWASTEIDTTYAWMKNFSSGINYNGHKAGTGYIRPALQLCAEGLYLSADGTCTTYN